MDHMFISHINHYGVKTIFLYLEVEQYDSFSY
jgi:hypothetical protein